MLVAPNLQYSFSIPPFVVGRDWLGDGDVHRRPQSGSPAIISLIDSPLWCCLGFGGVELIESTDRVCLWSVAESGEVAQIQLESVGGENDGCRVMSGETVWAFRSRTRLPKP